MRVPLLLAAERSPTVLVTPDDLMVLQENIRDITDSLIDHCEDRKLDENSNIQLSDEKIVGIVNDLFGAGSPSFPEP